MLKPGIKTSEFLLLAAAIAIAAFLIYKGHASAILLTLPASLYAAGRQLLKALHPETLVASVIGAIFKHVRQPSTVPACPAGASTVTQIPSPVPVTATEPAATVSTAKPIERLASFVAGKIESNASEAADLSVGLAVFVRYGVRKTETLLTSKFGATYPGEVEIVNGLLAQL